MKNILFTLTALFLALSTSSQISFTTLPKSNQLYPRDPATGQATPVISGTVNFAGTPYDKIYLKLYRNNIFQNSYSQPLSYSQGVANFSLSFPIAAELANYKIKIYATTGGNLTLVTSVDSIVAGDAFIITGQSNAAAGAVYGFANDDNKNSFIRVYGSGSISGYTPEWFEANGDIWDGGGDGNCGQWGLRLAKDLLDEYNIPVAIFNGANSGQPISWFQRNDANPQDQNTNYGRLLRRVTETSFLNNIRAVFWYQGESNSFGTTTISYKNSFNDLNNDWVDDYPGYEHLYIIQIKQGCGAGKTGVSKIQEAHRELAAEISNASVYATNGTNQASDKCHYGYKTGYKVTGDNLYRIINRDLYGGPDAANIESPYVISAVQSAPSQITLYFKNTGDAYYWTNGTEKDFKLEGSTVTVIIGTVSGSSVILTLSATPVSFTGLSYLGHQGPGSPTIRNSNDLGLVSFRLFPVTPFSPKLGVQSEPAVSFYPNPATEETTLRFQLIEQTEVTISIYESSGRKVLEKNTGNINEGWHTQTINLSELSQGLYMIALQMGNNIIRKQLIIE
ncbi:MAG: sialate O-acetylesterase [Chitinophagales bacterium]